MATDLKFGSRPGDFWLKAKSHFLHGKIVMTQVPSSTDWRVSHPKTRLRKAKAGGCHTFRKCGNLPPRCGAKRPFRIGNYGQFCNLPPPVRQGSVRIAVTRCRLGSGC